MLGTEIDDIFSGKTSAKVKSRLVPKAVEGKTKRPKSGDPRTTTMRDGEGNKRKKKKKEKNKGAIPSSKKVEEEVDGASAAGDENENAHTEPEMPVFSPTKKPTKRPRDEVEEVVDPSIMVKKPRLEKDGQNMKSKGGPTKVRKDGGTKDGLERFKDSRGASGRKRTEEGYQIYTEEELGMNKEGGDTVLCPFDCDCCY